MVYLAQNNYLNAMSLFYQLEGTAYNRHRLFLMPHRIFEV